MRSMLFLAWPCLRKIIEPNLDWRTNKDNNNIVRIKQMKVGIIGGTGGMGKGFALRLCINNDVLVGSKPKTACAGEYASNSMPNLF